MHLPRWLFVAELAWLLVALLLLWVLYLAQLLAWRFTPKHKWNDMKVHLLCCGVAGLLVQSIRAPDMSGGFGLMSTLAQRILYQQFGAFMLPAAIIVMLATARSLYVQMGRSVPPLFTRLMWAVAALYQLFVLPTLVGSLIAKRDNNPDGLMFWWSFNMWAWAGVSWLLLIIYWFFFLGLRKRVGAFVVTLQQQAARMKEAAPTSSVATAATAMPILSAHELHLITIDAQVQPQAHGMRSGQASDACDGGSQGDEGGGGGGAAVSSSPLLGASPPSDVEMAELSECGPRAGDQDGAAKQNPSRRSTMHLLETGAPPSGSATRPHAASSTLPSDPVSSPPSMPQHTGMAGSPSSCASFLRPPLSSSPGGNAIHPRLGPSLVSSPSIPTRMIRPSLAQVAPAPAPLLTPHTSAGGSAAHAGSTASAAPPSPTAPGVLQSELRLVELHRALHKLHLMTGLVTLLLMGSSCVQIPRLILYARGETLVEVTESPTDPDDPFPWLSGINTFVDVGGVCTILWYAWTSPRVWMGAARRARGLAFWHTLLHGVDEAAWERHAPASTLTDQQKKKTESVTGVRVSSLHANHATAAQGTANVVTLAIATVPSTAIGPPPATANSCRSAW